MSTPSCHTITLPIANRFTTACHPKIPFSASRTSQREKFKPMMYSEESVSLDQNKKMETGLLTPKRMKKSAGSTTKKEPASKTNDTKSKSQKKKPPQPKFPMINEEGAENGSERFNLTRVWRGSFSGCHVPGDRSTMGQSTTSSIVRPHGFE